MAPVLRPMEEHRGMPRLAFALALMFGLARIGAADGAVTIASAVDALSHGRTVVVGGETICASRPLPLFYTRRQLAPAWNAIDGDELLAAISDAAGDGLAPADYHLASITGTTDTDARDLLLTDAFLLLASHLLSGRVDPQTIEPTWCLTPRSDDLVSALETALELHQVRATMARMCPVHRDYNTLREALTRYRGMAAAGGWPALEKGETLHLGDRGPEVMQLAARLVASGDFPQPREDFDSSLDTAVRRFQRFHGLADDGLVGPRTREELNITAAQRVRQIGLNLERWRWLPSNLGDPYALINIPAFSLVVMEHQRSVISMRIVVGKEYQRTPIFSGAITQVILSPYWNVPKSIASKELWPREHSSPGYLAHEHIEVLTGGRLRQTPGPWNSLGLIKFNIPNQYDVYLHDTPARELFEQSARAFSHGCMRIEKPAELAGWLLRDRPEWTDARIVQESRLGIQTVVEVRKPLVIHVLYWTTFIDEAGDLHFAPDIYHRDPPLDAAMRRPPSRF
jgi:murein L,D-transpeptidase YcbB/YkuD